jgi:hypothetical protein
MIILAAILALVWGGIWAVVLQRTALGHYLARRRTWITVVVGVGVDIVIMRLALSWEELAVVFIVVAASSTGVIARSLVNEMAEDRGVLDAISTSIQQEAGE